LFFDSSIVYFDGFSHQRLNWYTKKRTPEYRYTKLRMGNFNFSSITRELPCCGMRGYGRGRCGGFSTDIKNQIVLEVGNNRLSNLDQYYAGIGYLYNGVICNYSLLGTIDGELNTGYRANFKVNLFSMPIQFLSPLQYWRNGSNLNIIGNDKGFKFSVGAEFRQRLQNKYTEMDLFSSFNYEIGKFKLFLNMGAGYRINGVFEKQWNRLIQFGTMFRLYEFKRFL
ncbi:MAG TPA: hypothetical protein VGF79_09660, partial [Bacteroidia bacterium]